MTKNFNSVTKMIKIAGKFIRNRKIIAV